MKSESSTLVFRLFCLRSWALGLASLLMLGSVHAFPPAPYYTIYGLVRDQVGQTLTVEGVTLILLKDGIEIGRTPVNNNQIDQSYDLKVRIDANRSGTKLYSQSALEAQSVFSLAVEMNGARFYPIEVVGTLTAGEDGERVRLDLNLGEDGDGLPDIWELWQLYQAGYFPDWKGDWPLNLIDRKNGVRKNGAR